MSGHGGNPGKFEPCRRFQVVFHNAFLIHLETKTTACLHGESYTEVRIFIQGQFSSGFTATCTVFGSGIRDFLSSYGVDNMVLSSLSAHNEMGLLCRTWNYKLAM